MILRSLSISDYQSLNQYYSTVHKAVMAKILKKKRVY